MKLSVVISIKNRVKLFRRSLKLYNKQSMPRGDWELVVVDDKVIKVFLLDHTFKKPVTKNSSVELSVKYTSGQIEKITCQSQDTFFICNLTGAGLKQANELKINSTRDKIKGSLATYALPLKFK